MLGDGAFASDAILTVALPADGEGDSAFVPAADVATVILAVRRDGGLVLVDPASVELERAVAATGEPVGRMSLDGLDGERIEGAAERLLELSTVALCAIEVGVAERQLELTADYLAGREQFERPRGSFQAVQQRLADAYIDMQAMRWTTWQVPSSIGAVRSASAEVAIAKLWAADGGAR